MTRQRTTTLLLTLLLGLSATAQQLDSLLAVWRDPQRPDSVRISAYSKYVTEGYLHSDPDSAFVLAEALIAFSIERSSPRGEAAAYNLQGNARLFQGRNAEAITYYRKCLAIYERTGNERGMGSTLGNIALIFIDEGDYPRAIDHLQRSMDLCERAGRTSCVANALHNLGNVYFYQERFENALAYYQRALAIDQASGNERSQASGLGDMGAAYAGLKQWDKALDHHRRALVLLERLNDKLGMGTALMNIGTVLADQGDHAGALAYYERSRDIAVEMGSEDRLCKIMYNMGQTYARMGDRRKAVVTCSEALDLATELDALLPQKDACQCLYDNHKALGRGDEALKYLERMRMLDDSLQAEETALKLEQMEFAQQLFADSVARAEETRLVEEAHREEIRTKNRARNYMAVGGLVLLLVAVGLYGRSRYMRRSRDLISQERDRSENLLLNILPAEVAAELKEKGRAEAREYAQVSILFTDFKGFTEASARLSAGELVNEINTCFEAFDRIIERHGIEKIKTIGDAYMAAGGLPVPAADSAQRTVMAALDMQDFITTRHAERAARGLPAFEMRVGIHTGPVVAGIVGVKKFQYDIWGDTVNTASRMESSGEAGKVNISEATYALVRHEPGLTFTPRGKVQAKGKGEMEMYFVEPDVRGIS